MSAQIANTSNEGEGDQSFNFDEWIISNELESIKELLKKHGAVTPSTLSLDSKEFQSVMSDPQLFSKPHMIPKLMGAVHTISVFLIKIVISEEEVEIIEAIQQHLKALNEEENELSKLKEEHPKSMERIKNDKLKQLELAKKKTNKIFDDLLDALNKRRDIIINQIDTIKSKVGNDKKNNNFDDEKETDLFSSCTENIESSRNFLKEKEEIYNKLTSTNDNRTDRKSKIVNMGKEVSDQFTKSQSTLTNNIDIIGKQIKTNNALTVDIDFCINDKKYDRMIKNIEKFGKIINKTSGSLLKENKEDDVQSDDDDDDIKEIKQKLKQKDDAYKQLQSKLEQIINEKVSDEKQSVSKLKQSISFSANDKHRWFKWQDDEKEQNTLQCVKVMQQNPVCIKINKKVTKNVSDDVLFLSPPIQNINDVCKYNQYLLIQATKLLKSEWYHPQGLERYHPQDPAKEHPGFLSGLSYERKYTCCSNRYKSPGCAVIYPCCNKRYNSNDRIGCAQRYKCCDQDYKRATKGCTEK